MGVPSSQVPGANKARNEHIEKYTKVDPADAAKPALSVYAQLIERIKHDGQYFVNWENARKHYDAIRHETALPGSENGVKRRAEALQELRIARIEYLAPLDVATAKGREGKLPPLLTSEEWEILACARDSNISDLIGSERAAAVEKFKKDNYGQYEGMITDDQITRAGSTVGGLAFKRFRDNAAYIGTSLWNGDFGNLRYATASAGEKALIAHATKAEARADLEVAAKTIHARDRLDKHIEAEAAKGNKSLTDDEREKKLHEFGKEEVAKINDEAIEARMATINASRAATRDQAEAGQKAYVNNVTELTQHMQIALQAVNKFEEDITATNSEAGQNIQDKNKKKVDETVIKATAELESAIVHDFHHHSRLAQEQKVGAGMLSRYGTGEKNMWGNEANPVRASQKEISEEFATTLGKLDENAHKYEKDDKGNPPKLKKGEVLTVNNIPCSKVGVVEMYDVDRERSIMGLRFDSRTQRIGKMIESWALETTAANQSNYKEGTLSREQMMLAYSSEKTVPDGKNGTKPNANIGPDGRPINALRISTFPIRGGVASCCRAFAEMRAMAHILGIAIDINTSLIAQNSKDPEAARGYAIIWDSHSRLDDEEYGKPAMKKVLKDFGIPETLPIEQQRVILWEKLAGNDVLGAKIGWMASNAEKQAQTGMVVEGSNEGAKPTSTSTSVADPALTTMDATGAKSSASSAPTQTSTLNAATKANKI